MRVDDEIIVRCPFYPAVSQNSEWDLNKITVRNDLMEAIYLASPTLYKELLKFKSGRLTKAKDIKKLEASTFKYLIRSSTRSTPFGLFAGVTTCKFSDNNQ